MTKRFKEMSQEPNVSSNSLMSRIRSSLNLRVSKHMEEIEDLNRRVKTITDPEAANLLNGIQSRLVAAVNIDNLEDTIAAGD